MALPTPGYPTYELELPSNGKTVKYRPFLVKEEKVLLLALESQDEKQITNAVKDLIKNWEHKSIIPFHASVMHSVTTRRGK